VATPGVKRAVGRSVVLGDPHCESTSADVMFATVTRSSRSLATSGDWSVGSISRRFTNVGEVLAAAIGLSGSGVRERYTPDDKHGRLHRRRPHPAALWVEVPQKGNDRRMVDAGQGQFLVSRVAAQARLQQLTAHGLASARSPAATRTRFTSNPCLPQRMRLSDT